jgi:cytochrome c
VSRKSFVYQKFFVSFAFVFVSVMVSAGAMSAQAQKTTWDGVYTAEQARKGEALYKAQCAACHGEAMAGAEAAPPLVGDTFNANWEGAPLADLFERMRVTMPLTKPGSLSRAANAEILAFMLETGKFPAGETPLDPLTLPSIAYRTYRP